jgi:uncharacterized repeat protein (TIGR02543 family)
MMVVFTNNNPQITTIGNCAFQNSSLNLQNFIGLSIKTTIPPTVQEIGGCAFDNASVYSDFDFQAANQLTSIGEFAFANNSISRIHLPSSITTIGDGAFNNNDYLTLYTENLSTPVGWSIIWNSSSRPVLWGCTFGVESSFNYVISCASVTNPNGHAINNPIRNGYDFGGWYTTSNFSGTQYTDLRNAPANTKMYAKWSKTSSSCVAEGTLITLADGSKVAVEELTGEEMLLVWNLFTGEFDVAPILFIDSDPYTEYEIIHLFFSDGTEVKVISEHAFFSITESQYVFMRSDASKYIGDWFITGDGEDWGIVQLVDVQIYTEFTTAWSPVTFGHLCYYVNGMLSMPGATEGLINIFEVNTLTMQVDEAQMLLAIAEYGLLDYSEVEDLMPELVFEAFNGQYLLISIGKGLISWDGIFELLERYAPFFV